MDETSDQTPSRSARDRHRALYREIPAMRCVEGCHRCCGAAPVSPWEARRLGLAEDAVLTPTHPGTTTCAFLVEGRCTVYARRPFACRLYGTTPAVPCEAGASPPAVMAVSIVRAADLLARFERECPPGWHARRRNASREVLQAHGTPEELAAHDEFQSNLASARGQRVCPRRGDRGSSRAGAARGSMDSDARSGAGNSLTCHHGVRASVLR